MKFDDVMNELRALPEDPEVCAMNVHFFVKLDNGVTLIEIRADIPLTDRITPLVEHIFTSGQCHALAVALHDILGWPVMGTYSQWDFGSRETSHYVVACPSGGEADIHGIRCLDHGLRKASAETIRRGRARGFLPLSMALARHYAPMIAADILAQESAMKSGKSKPKWKLCPEGYTDTPTVSG